MRCEWHCDVILNRRSYALWTKRLNYYVFYHHFPTSIISFRFNTEFLFEKFSRKKSSFSYAFLLHRVFPLAWLQICGFIRNIVKFCQIRMPNNAHTFKVWPHEDTKHKLFTFHESFKRGNNHIFPIRMYKIRIHKMYCVSVRWYIYIYICTWSLSPSLSLSADVAWFTAVFPQQFSMQYFLSDPFLCLRSYFDKLVKNFLACTMEKNWT